MLIIHGRAQPQDHCDAELPLPFELRQKARLRARLPSGEEVGIFLDHGGVLRDGDLLRADDGRIVRVVAAPEPLLEVRCETPQAMARAAYHLGNRHALVQVGEGFLRLQADEVLAQMLRGLGAQVFPLCSPFEPEAGAYAGRHDHSMGARHSGVIHDFVEKARG